MAIASPCADTTDPQVLLEELDRLADNSATLEELLAGLLPTITAPLNAEAGVLWLIDAQSNLRPAFQERWQATGLSREAGVRQAHHSLVLHAVERNQIEILCPDDRDNSDILAPRSFAFVPLHRKDSLIGVLELVFANPLNDPLLAVLQEVLEACEGHVSQFLPDQAAPHSLDNGTFTQKLDSFLLRLYDTLDTRQLSTEAVGGIRDLLGVDRVSILLPGRRHPRIIAVSGQSQPSGYSPVVRRLQSLARGVLRCQEVLIQANNSSLPSGIDNAELADYLELTGTKMLAMVPLNAAATKVTDAAPGSTASRHSFQPAGVLVVERLRTSRFDANQRETLGILSDHLGNALGRAAAHESIPLLTVLRPIGRGCRWLYLHQFWCCLFLFLMAIAGSISLFMIQWDYRVAANGVLMPEEKRQIFAPADAEVDMVYVRGDETIQRGDPLIKLVSRELESEELRLRTIIQEKQTSLRALRVARETSTRAGEIAQTIEIEGRLAEHRIELRHLQLEHEIVMGRLKQLIITAPVDGVVATFQVEQLLAHRPVNRGDHLLDVMDPDSRWNLELKVEDRRLGHLLNAKQNTPTLPVEFVLATNPEQHFSGRLATIGCRSHCEANTTATVDLLVELEDADSASANASRVMPPLRIGAEVTAKVNCGQKPLGYVLFGDVIDFLRTQLWL